MRIVFIGSVEFSYATLEAVRQVETAEVVGVVTRASSAFNADFRSLEPLAESMRVPCLTVADRDDKLLAEWIGAREPDVVYCFGWSYLLGPAVLNVAPKGVVGYHPAELPRNRGRHPIVWALALGLERTASTFFFMDEGADSGDIISQVAVPIFEVDDAGELYLRLQHTAIEQITDFTPRLASGGMVAEPQDHSRANYWRKRAERDGLIDWRMSSWAIYNLVRALARPYVGAHALVNGQVTKVWASRQVGREYRDVSHLEPGKVLAVRDQMIDVKCGDGVIRLEEHQFTQLPDVGSYL